METEQAHSSRTYPLPAGRDAALLRLRTPLRAVAARPQSPAVWLNLVCLDAPLVSVAWLWLFAAVFHVAVDPANGSALFLTAWVIYLADRLADSCSLEEDALRSLRHEFCLKHRQIWIGALAVTATIDASLIWRSVGPETFLCGAIAGTLALLYLVLNYSLGGAWPLPLKEFAIGSLFAAGTLVALSPAFPPMTRSLLFSGMAFASVCTLNCISIAFWERELDERQRKISFATRYPTLERHLGKLSVALGLSSGAMGVIYREAAPIFFCVTVSSLFLALLNSSREKIGRDQRTALADLVLLTPLLILLVMNA
ncbi:MAG: hypothetical protein QOE34_1811 [Verrucomicrobiota bacterium]